MRASSGLYISRLDHVRGIAALMVYCWHFVHVHVPFSAVPAFAPLSLLEEGHIGVGLFMTLSGYLFAKILDGKPLDLPRFYRNRLLRLAPLLTVALGYWALRGHLSLEAFLSGFVLPTWSGGAWSVAVELHFYLLFPFVLMMQRHHRIWPLVAFVAGAIGLRTAVWWTTGSVQVFSYWTLGGAIDLFVLGMLWHELSKRADVAAHAGILLAGAAVTLTGLWHAFNAAGGFYGFSGYPSASPLWIAMPTLQGLVLGALIVGYEKAAFHIPSAIDRVLAKVGEVSYSIYLMHFIAYPSLAKLCLQAGFPMSDPGSALALALATFPLIVAIAIVTYTLIEQPFLRLRGRYDAESATGHAQPAQGAAPAAR